MEEDASLQIIWRIRAACQSRSNTMHECNRLFDIHIYMRCGYMCWRAQSTGRILSHHCRSGNCAGRSIKRGSALGFHRGNLQRWTSLPVYYQVVYFTVVRLCVWAPRDLSFSLSLFYVSFRRLRHDRCTSSSSPSLSFSPSRYAPTGTYRTTFLLPYSQWPATATLPPRVLHHPTPLSL